MTVGACVLPITRSVTRAVTRPAGGGGGPPAPSMTPVSFSGAADWWAGTKAGTHQEVWAGNASRDTLTMGYGPVMPVAAGIRTWFGGPDAAFYNGCAYVPTASPKAGNMVLGIAKFVYATGTWTYAAVKTITGSVDDHLKFNVHICSDGKILLLLARQDYDNHIHWWKSTNAEDISAWSAERTLTLSGQTPNYPTIARFSSKSNRIYVVFRDAMYGAGAGDGGLWYISSDDEFATDGGGGHVFGPTKIVATAAGAVGGNSGLYFHGGTNGTDRFDIAFSHFYDNSATPKIVHDVVHFYLEETAANQLEVFASDGTSLGAPAIGSTGSSVAYASFTAANKSLIYDTSVDTGSYRMWVADVQCYDGEPAVTACRYTDGATNTDYDYLRWDFASGAWSSAKVVWDASVDGTNGPVGTGSYDNYYGGCRMDASDANLMYLCAGNQSGTSRLKKLVSNDLFAANRTVSEPFTQGRRHNIRPAIPFNLAGEHVGKMDVLWCAGRYTTATSYDTVQVHPYWGGVRNAFDFNEASGTAASKINGYSYTPANVGSPTYNQTGIGNGKAVSFNGTSTAVNLGAGVPLADRSVSALLMWQKMDGLAATQVMGATDGGGGRKFWGILNTNEYILGVGSSSAGSSLGGTGMTAGAWHHWGVLCDESGGNPRMAFHLDGTSKFTHTDGYSESGLAFYIGANNNGAGGANWVAGDTCQYIEDIAVGRNTAFIAAVAGYAAAGTFVSATKTASVTNGPVVGPTVTPSVTLPTGASYTLKLISTSTPAGQTKTGTASTPIVFDGVTIADGDSVSIEIAAASSDKTVAPTFTSFDLAA